MEDNIVNNLSKEFYIKNKSKSKGLLHFMIREMLVKKDFSKKELIYLLQIIDNL